MAITSGGEARKLMMARALYKTPLHVAGRTHRRRRIRCRSTRCTAASVTSPADAPLSKSVTGWPPAASATRFWCSLHRPAGQPSAAAGGGGSMPGCGTLRRSMIPMPCDALSFQVYQVISHDGRYPPETIPPGDIFCHFLQADCFSRRLH